LATILETLGHRFDQPLAVTPIGRRKQYRSTITGTMRLVKLHYYRARVKTGKQTTLCRDRIFQAKAFRCAANTA
jgi:hypothetical protein